MLVWGQREVSVLFGEILFAVGNTGPSYRQWAGLSYFLGGGGFAVCFFLFHAGSQVFFSNFSLSRLSFFLPSHFREKNGEAWVATRGLRPPFSP